MIGICLIILCAYKAESGPVSNFDDMRNIKGSHFNVSNRHVSRPLFNTREDPNNTIEQLFVDFRNRSSGRFNSLSLDRGSIDELNEYFLNLRNKEFDGSLFLFREWYFQTILFKSK